MTTEEKLLKLIKLADAMYLTTEEKLLKLIKLADAMYYAAQQLTTDASRLHKAMEDYHQFIVNDYHEEEPSIREIVDEHFWEMLGEEPVSEDRFVFKAIPRLLELIEPTDRAKTYIAKLADALEKEGYITDAKIVRESIKIMNGEKVPMATMDEESVCEDLEKAVQHFIEQHKSELSGYIDIRRIARYFANWQREQDKMVEKLMNKNYAKGFDMCKQQMMKDAVDAQVIPDNHIGCTIDNSIIKQLVHDFQVFDKVKLIIIKED